MIPPGAARLALTLCALLAASPLTTAATFAPQPPSPEWFAKADQDAMRLTQELFSNETRTRSRALRRISRRRSTDMVAPLIIALRFFESSRDDVLRALRRITGANPGSRWHDWVEWQELNPDIRPYPGFDAMQAAIYSNLDPGFRKFLGADRAHSIRLEEVVWGGVLSDGIPALTDPVMIPADEATWLDPDERVFGVEINGDARAYPYRIMDWHEMFNDVVGGQPVSLAYCTLCGSGILYDTRRVDLDGSSGRYLFGSSGFLYRSNKLMYDHASGSLWNQFTGRPVVGALTHSGIELPVLPVVTTHWANWRRTHPHTRVLSRETGHDRPYQPGAAYGRYFASDKLMFPAALRSDTHRAKDRVFVLRVSGARRSWPLTAFRKTPVINDRVGVIDLVVIGNPHTEEVRAYRAEGLDFDPAGTALRQRSNSQALWKITEAALVGPGGRQLTRLPGHVAYWFASASFLGTQ